MKKFKYIDQPIVNNLKDILELQLKRNPNDIAFTYHDKDEIKTKTFKDVYNDSINLSNYFYKNYKNEKIALIGENSYNWIILLFGIILSGNTAVSIDKDIDEDLLKKLLKQADCKNVYYSKEYVSSIDNIKVNKNYIDDTNKYISLGKKCKNKYTYIEDNPALIIFTSGTTGPNKAVVLTEKNLAYDTYVSASVFLVTGKTLLLLPNHHAFGIVAAMLMNFYYGKNTFINESLRYLTKDMKYHKPKLILVVPLFVETFYKQIYKTAKSTNSVEKLEKGIKISNFLRKFKIDIRKKLFKDILNTFGGELEYIISGGAHIDHKYIDFFDSIGISIVNGYGITECSPVVAINGNRYSKKNSVGHIVKDTEVKIIDDEICIKSPIVMKEYYKDNKATKQVMIENYFHTGDIGYIDKDNFLYITGRIKNLIILSNGENISPESIENVLLKDDNIEEIVVYSKDNLLIASIYPSEEYLNNNEYFEELIHKYNEDKPKNKQISKVIVREKEHIKNSNKKILRNKVIEGE